MNLAKPLLITCLVMIFSGCYSQCRQKIDLVRVKAADAQLYGEFKLNINGDYDGQLMLLDGAGYKQVKSLSGTGNSSVLLTNLLKDNVYKVVLDFKNEERFLCKRKVVLIPLEGE